MEGGYEYKKGLWNTEEDRILMDYVKRHGVGKWNRIAKLTGLKRCGKSCRLRWMNYLSPNIKRGDFSEEEDDLIIRLHNLLGNRWSLIAGRVPGRTDNQVKNYWNTHLSKKVGVNKKEKIKTCQSLKHFSNKQKDVTLNISSDPNKRPSNCNDKGDEIENFVKTSTEYFPNMNELIMSDIDFEFESAFWFSNNIENSTSFSYSCHDCFVDLNWSDL